MIELHRQCGGIATLALAVVRRPEAYSRIEVDSDARIRRMRLLKGRGRGDFNDYPKGLTAVMAAPLEPATACGVHFPAPRVPGIATTAQAVHPLAALLSPLLPPTPPPFP